MINPKMKSLSGIGALLVLALIFIIFQVFFYLQNEQPVYYWDFKGYWMMWQEYAQLVRHDFPAWLQKIGEAVRHNDYNPLSIVLLFPFSFLPFSARANYLLATSICYLLPVSLLIATVFQRFQGFQSRVWSVCIFLFALTYPLFWATIFRGFPDIAGLIPVLLVILYVLKTDLTEKLSVKSILILGILLWLPFGLRRWYAFTIVTLYLTLPFLNFSIFSLVQPKRFKKFILVALNFCGAGIVSVLLVFFLQYDLMKIILQTNYANLYAAYNEGILLSLETAVKHLGLYLLPTFGVGLFWSFQKERCIAKNFAVFCFVNLVICFFLFTKTQTPGIQHILPFSLWVFFICVFGLRWIAEKLTHVFTWNVFLICCVVIALFINFVTFYKMKGGVVCHNVFFPAKHYPLQLENFDNYKKMAENVEAYATAGNNVTIISAGKELNEDLVLTLTGERTKAHLAPQAQFDLIQGLVLERFQARYVIVGYPDSVKKAEGRSVVTIPTQELLSGTGIGAAYKRLPDEYLLANNRKGIVFEKIRPFTQQELKDFVGQFVALYPEWADIYMTPFALSFVDANVTLGDASWSIFQYQKDGSILAHPGATQPVMVEWVFGDISNLTVQSVDYTCQEKNHPADGVIVILENEDGAYQRVDVPYLATVSFDITEFANKKGKLMIEPNANPSCDAVKITASKN